MNDNAVSVKASELRRKDHIEARIAELIDKKQKRLDEMEHRSHDRWYKLIWREAENGDTSSARVSALREIGKAIGVLDKTEEEVKKQTAKDIADELTEKLEDLGIRIELNATVNEAE